MLHAYLLFGAMLGAHSAPQSGSGPYHLLTTQKVGGVGSFDYVYADSAGRRLYVPRMGAQGHVAVYELGSLKSAGELPDVSGHGVAVDDRYHTGFLTSKPVAMFDTRTLTLLKSIQVDGRPDGILGDPFNHRIYILSHQAPNATVIDAKDGTLIGTIDLGGEPEQAVTDGHGHIFVDLENKGAVAEVDAQAMKVINTFSLGEHGGGNAGLAFDPRNHVLFVACREPKAMVMIDSTDGHFLASLPIGDHCDGAVFNPQTNECLSSQGDGTLSVIHEDSPTTFSIEQVVKTLPGAKTITLDRRTGHLFLITAEYGAPTAGANGGRPGRGQMVSGSFSVLVVGK